MEVAEFEGRVIGAHESRLDLQMMGQGRKERGQGFLERQPVPQRGFEDRVGGQLEPLALLELFKGAGECLRIGRERRFLHSLSLSSLGGGAAGA